MHKRLNAARLLAGGDCLPAFGTIKKKNQMKEMHKKMNKKEREKNEQQQQVNLQLEAPLGSCILRPCNVPAGRKHRY